MDENQTHIEVTYRTTVDVTNVPPAERDRFAREQLIESLRDSLQVGALTPDSVAITVAPVREA